MSNPIDNLDSLESRKTPWPKTLVAQSNPGISSDLLDKWKESLREQTDRQSVTEQHLNNYTNDRGFVGMTLSFDERWDQLTARGITAEEFFKKEYLCNFANDGDDRELDNKGNPTGRRYHKSGGACISSMILDELDIDGG